MRSMIVSGVLVACAVTCLLAQRVTEQARVDLVLIDVNVVDRSGLPIADLATDDFQVTVDHKPRKIVNAQFLRYDVRNSLRPAAPAAAAAPAVPVPASPRDVLIVVDEDTLEAGDALGARRAAEKFIDDLPAIDRVGVVTVPRLPSHITLTSNREDAKKSLSVLKTSGVAYEINGTLTIGLAEAFDIDKNRDGDVIARVVSRECHVAYRDSPGNACVQEVFRQAHTMTLSARNNAQQRFDALRVLAEELARLPGRKTMVLISGGFTEGETTTAFGMVARAFAASEISLYTIFVERSQIGQAQHKVSPSPVEDQNVQRFGLENVTTATGGTLLLSTGSLETEFARVITELSGAYLLSIEVAPEDRDGKLHFVQVTVNRAGIDVRARQQYVIRPEKAVTETVEPQPDAKPTPPAPTRPVAKPSASATDSSEVTAVLARASAYVAAYDAQYSALVAEERYDQTLSKINKATTVSNDPYAKLKIDRDEYAWEVTERRTTRSDFLLVKAPTGGQWVPFRDVFEVDGKKLRDRENRLQKLFLEEPRNAATRALEILKESARYNIGFVDRNINVPTLALAVLADATRARFSFRKQGERTIEGVKTWELTYVEHGSPTLVRTNDRDVPAEGALFVDPGTGSVVRTTLRFRLSETITHEVTVTYHRAEKAGTVWVPAEMREVITAPNMKLECTASYSNLRRFQVSTTTDVKRP